MRVLKTILSHTKVLMINKTGPEFALAIYINNTGHAELTYKQK